MIYEVQGKNFLLYSESDENVVIKSDINEIKNEKIDLLLLSESIGDYLNASNFCPGEETADSEKEKDEADQLTPEQKADNNFLDLIEYYCKFCAREKELPPENKNDERHQLFNTKKEYLFGFIKSNFEIMRDNNNRIAEFMTQFSSRFIENHKIKTNNDAERKEIANFINWLGENGFYPYDDSYLVVLDDEIYPTSIRYTEIVQIVKNLDVFFEIDLENCTVKLKDEDFRSAIFNVLKNKSNKIDRTDLFENFYERVMKDEKVRPDEKKECLNKIMPQLLKFISVYGLLDKTKMDHNDDPTCYYLDFDRFNDLIDSQAQVDDYVDKLWEDILCNSVDYSLPNGQGKNYIKILGVIKNMVNGKKLTLRENNVQVIKSLIKKFLLVDQNCANLLKKEYLRAFFEKTDVNNITQSDSFKRLTLAFEIVSRLVGDDKEDQEHEVKKFFDDEIKKLFGLDGLQNSLLGFIDPTVELKAIKFNPSENENESDVINKFVGNFKDALGEIKTSMKTESLKKVFEGVKPDFDSAMSICERLFDETMAYKTHLMYKFEDMDGYKKPPYNFMIELFLTLLKSDDFELDSKEKMKRVYVLYLKIIDFGVLNKQGKGIKTAIKTKIYGTCGFSLLKDIEDNREIINTIIDKNGKKHYNTKKLIGELFEFTKWTDIVDSDKDFFKYFIVDIVFHIEKQDSKITEDDKNKFYGIYGIKSLKGYKSFQNQLSNFGFGSAIGELLKSNKYKQREFIFNTDLFLELVEKYSDSCLNVNSDAYKFVFESDFIFILTIDEITIDNVNNAFSQYFQKLQNIFKDKEGGEGDKYQKLKDDFLGLFGKALINHCELILSNEEYCKDKNKDELKNDYIKTIITFCRDKETKIIRFVLENCTMTEKGQKNEFIKPYAIIEALLNDDNFKLDAEKTALIIEWFIKYNVNELGIEPKGNETYDNLSVINKLFEKIETDQVELDYKIYNELLKNKFTYYPDKSGNSYNMTAFTNKDFNKKPENLVACQIGNKIYDQINTQVRNKKNIQDNKQFQNNGNDNINNDVLGNANSNQEIKENDKKTSSTFKITKLISFMLITITGLILVLNSFIHMFSLSLFLSVTLILACIIFDMALFENGRKILKTLLCCIFCCTTETDNSIGKNNYQGDKSSIFNGQDKIISNNNNINLIATNELEEKR